MAIVLRACARGCSSTRSWFLGCPVLCSSAAWDYIISMFKLAQIRPLCVLYDPLQLTGQYCKGFIKATRRGKRGTDKKASNAAEGTKSNSSNCEQIIPWMKTCRCGHEPDVLFNLRRADLLDGPCNSGFCRSIRSLRCPIFPNEHPDAQKATVSIEDMFHYQWLKSDLNSSFAPFSSHACRERSPSRVQISKLACPRQMRLPVRKADQIATRG